MDENEKIGLAAAVDDLMADDRGPPDDGEGEQIALLPLDAPRDVIDAKPLPAIPNRGRGRPPGATNKASRKWRDYLAANYASPLIGLAEWISVPVDELARRLKCDLLDAAKLQMVAQSKLAEYTNQKLTTADDGDGDMVPLVISVSPEVAKMIASAKQGERSDSVAIDATVMDGENAEKSEG